MTTAAVAAAATVCVCFICIFNRYIYYIYFLIGLNFFRELTQRFFLHAIFLISILLLFLCPATSPACVPPNESLN